MRSPLTTALRRRSAPAAAACVAPCARAATAIGSTPRAAWIAPSSDSSPSSTTSSTARHSTTPAAASTPSAIGRSNAAPAFRTSAGARLTVTRSAGNSKPQLRMAARTRSRLSRTLASGRPTIVNIGQPERDIDFDVDRDGLDAEHRGRPDARQHRRTCVQAERQAPCGHECGRTRGNSRGRVESAMPDSARPQPAAAAGDCDRGERTKRDRSVRHRARGGYVTRGGFARLVVASSRVSVQLDCGPAARRREDHQAVAGAHVGAGAGDSRAAATRPWCGTRGRSTRACRPASPRR